jgi:hypothetical protein
MRMLLGCDVSLTDTIRAGPEIPASHFVIEPRTNSPGCTYDPTRDGGLGIPSSLVGQALPTAHGRERILHPVIGF